jgi:thioester reductase-like protein/acyl-CoA synthetase (AMP-forming)/AMP-acid ligase II
MPSTVLGQRLIPMLVDQLAQSEPDRIIYSVARTHDPSGGFLDVSAQALARAVDRCSWHIEERLGRGENFPTLAYMGPQDALYSIFILAGIKTGYKIFLDSPRNSREAHVHLFEKTQCSTLCIPSHFSPPLVKDLAAAGIEVIEIPGLHHWLEDGEGHHDKPYPYNKTFAEAASDPIAILHTSGSTGMPKPVVQTHSSHTPMDACAELPSLGYEPTFPAMCAGARVYLGVPLFHAAGFSIFLAGAIYNGFTIVLGPFPPTAEIANAVHVHGNVQNSILIPWTLMELSRNPNHLDNLGLLDYIIYGGGLLPQVVGDSINKKTRLLNCLGSTECGTFPVQLCDREDWAYLSVSPVLGCEYRQVSDDLYEQVIVRNPKLQIYQGVFKTFPELTEWPMKDLYSKHPTKPNLWLYKGRIDDIIVFSNGEKFNPVDMEAEICTHPAVNAAIVAGFGKFQSSLLVEATNPPSGEDEKEHLLETIWQTVEAANQKCPSHGRVHRHMIIFSSSDKPLPRASKGTVQRKPAVHLYTEEIDALYHGAGKLTGEVMSVSGSHDPNDMVKQVIAQSTDIGVDDINVNADLFELGMDSLQVNLITRRLNQWLLAHDLQPSLETRTIYQNPRITALASVLTRLSKKETLTGDDGDRGKRLLELFNLHASQTLVTARKPESKPDARLVVLLTGCTGSLGPYILDSLLRDTRVSHIYCLGRGPSLADRLQASLAAKQLQPLSEKVTCHDAELSKQFFGLGRVEYKQLLSNVTTVIHNAWQVDFNLSVESFGSQLVAVRQLIDFSKCSRFGAKIVFTSSISAVANWSAITGMSGKVLEHAYEEWTMPHAIGYAQSKFIAECLLQNAAKDADIPASICRVSQVAGPTATAGIWAKQEWLPSLIASSKYVGKLPTSLGRHEIVDWVPVNAAAQAIVEIAADSPKTEGGLFNGAGVYHIANPRCTTWGRLLPCVKRCLDPTGNLETVPLKEWVGAIRERHEQTNDITRNPATKLLHFFDGLVCEDEPLLLDLQRSLQVSPTLANLEEVQDEWIENWIRQWAF